MSGTDGIARLWDAGRSLRDNPLYRLERRHQRLTAVLAILLVVLPLCSSCGYTAAFFLAPSFAATAITREKRARTWEALLLTRLNPEEMLLGKLVAALQVPVLLVLFSSVIMGCYLKLMDTLFQRGGMSAALQAAGFEGLHGWAPLVIGMALMAVDMALCLVAGGLAGIWSGLHHDDQFSAIGEACLFMILIEAVFTATLIAGDIFPGFAGTPMFPMGLTAGDISVVILYAIWHIAFIAVLAAACLRAIRRPAR